MPRKKCPGGHFILGVCVRGDTFRGDTIYYDTGIKCTATPVDAKAHFRRNCPCI